MIILGTQDLAEIKTFLTSKTRHTGLTSLRAVASPARDSI